VQTCALPIFLADNDDSVWLGDGALIKAVEAAAAAVAVKPALLDDATDRRWLRRLIGATAAIAADDGLRAAFSREGLDSLLDSALSDLDAHPQLLLEDPGLLQAGDRGIFRTLASGETRQMDSGA